MKATVIYPKDSTFQVEIPSKHQGNINNILSYLFDATNPDSGNDTITKLNVQGARLRSSMVGDIYIVDGRSFMVDRVGFVEVDEINSLRLQQLEDRDRLMGWDWICVNSGLIPIKKWNGA